MGIFWDLLGTSLSKFKIGLQGVVLKNSSGNLLVRDTGDSAYAEITASKFKASGDVMELNSDAAASGADYKYTLQRPSSGMSAAVTLTLPPDDGTPGQVAATDGSGNLYWASAGDTSMADKLDTTSLAFGDSSPVAMFTTGTGDVIEYIDFVIDTPFDGTPTASIGVSGTTSKYLGATSLDLTAAAGTTFRVHPGLDAQGVESLILTYSAGGAAAGAARAIVHYATPA